MMFGRPVRLAVALWIVFAIVVWNVVFDRMLVLAGRRYVYTAWMAAAASGPYVLVKDWMQPAIVHARWTATAAGGAVLAVGLLGIAAAARPRRARRV
jgi:hypothetical protein